MKRHLPQVVLVIAATIWISGELFAQPFNVQFPIDTSGPNGERQEIHPSGEFSHHPRAERRLQPKYFITYFPI